MPETGRDPAWDRWSLQDRVDRFGHEGMTRRAGSEELQAGQWTPVVDISENSERIVLRADLPGIEQDDVELRVEDGTLVLRGQRKPPPDPRSQDMLRVERPQGAFVRSFSLPSNVDQAGIRAALRNGVLEVVLPKMQESRAKAIRIDVK